MLPPSGLTPAARTANHHALEKMQDEATPTLALREEPAFEPEGIMRRLNQGIVTQRLAQYAQRQACVTFAGKQAWI